jgi:hypothetical protein
MVKEIQLTRGLFAKIDDADFESVSQFNWAAAFKGLVRQFVRKDLSSAINARNEYLLSNGISIPD